MRKLALATVFFLLAGIGVASAQYIGGGSIGAAGGGGGAFTGGTLLSALISEAVASANAMISIVGQTGQTGNYFDVTAEDDTIPRAYIAPNGTGGSMKLIFRPVSTGASGNYVELGTSGNSWLTLNASEQLGFPGGAWVGTATVESTGWYWTTSGLRAPLATTGTPRYSQLPRAIAASGITLPTCSTGVNAGSMIYSDDTDDAAAGMTCVCRADNGGTYAWVDVADNSTACIDP